MAHTSNEGILFNTMPSIYWDDHVKISYLQRRIIVYSIMYYERDESCVSDRQYDMISQRLVHLQSSVDEEEFKKSTYYYVMYDFDGSIGFHLYSRLNKKDKEWLGRIADMVYKQWKNDTTPEQRKEALR